MYLNKYTISESIYYLLVFRIEYIKYNYLNAS